MLGLIRLTEKFINFIFNDADKLIEQLPISDWAIDAICDSIHLLPFLFIIFLFIEIFETHYSNKLRNYSKGSIIMGPFIGSVLAGIPQCGFSVIATPLYISGLITKGTLIAIYISTSDEAIPVLMTNPSHYKYVVPLLLTKIVLGILSGYLIDYIFPPQKGSANEYIYEAEQGCCEHEIPAKSIKSVFLHPLKHTLNVFVLILTISLLLNYCFNSFGAETINKILLNNSIFQPILTSIIGLIPNCAVSVLITMLYINGVLTFPSVIAGLSSGAGLGLVVLLKRNPDIKDSLKIVGILLLIAVMSGILLTIIL